MVHYVGKLIASVYKKCLDEVFGTYKDGGFEIIEVQCYNEFHKVMDNYSIKKDPPIHINYVATKPHVPHAKTTAQDKNVSRQHIMDCHTHTFAKIIYQISGNRDRKKIDFFQTNMVSSTSAHR